MQSHKAFLTKEGLFHDDFTRGFLDCLPRFLKEPGSKVFMNLFDFREIPDIKAIEIASGAFHSAALDDHGVVYTWGHGKSGIKSINAYICKDPQSLHLPI